MPWVYITSEECRGLLAQLPTLAERIRRMPEPMPGEPRHEFSGLPPRVRNALLRAGVKTKEDVRFLIDSGRHVRSLGSLGWGQLRAFVSDQPLPTRMTAVVKKVHFKDDFRRCAWGVPFFDLAEKDSEVTCASCLTKAARRDQRT